MEVIGNGGYKHKKEYEKQATIKNQIDINRLIKLEETIQRLEKENVKLNKRLEELDKKLVTDKQDSRIADKEFITFRNDIKNLKKFRAWCMNQFDRFYQEFDERITFSLERIDEKIILKKIE